MADIGKLNNLEIIKEVDFGVYLDGGEHGEILMPEKYVPENSKVGDIVEVFVYLDSNDTIIATKEKPLAMTGEFASLEVVAVNNTGVFLSWGLIKDLLVPYREQKYTMEVGRSYIVYVYHDTESNRIAATTKLDKFIEKDTSELNDGDKVDLLVFEKTELGYKAIINKKYSGIIYKNEVFQKLKKGMQIEGFIKNIREDGKIDLCLQKPGYESIDKLSENILIILKEKGGSLKISDKSSPEEISQHFGISKKSFKKAIGSLYKKKIITIENDEIKLQTL